MRQALIAGPIPGHGKLRNGRLGQWQAAAITAAADVMKTRAQASAAENIARFQAEAQEYTAQIARERAREAAALAAAEKAGGLQLAGIGGLPLVIIGGLLLGMMFRRK